MKPRAWALFVTVAVAATSARAQGTFQNLDFEAAKVVFLTPGKPLIATSNALPGWTATFGASQLTAVPYLAGGGAGVVLFGLYGSSIDGSFSVGIGAGAAGDASISQTGLVPADARSLLFKVSYGGAVASRSTDIVSLGGQSLPLVALSSSRAFTLFGADISQSAGQTETLSFYSLASDPQSPPVYALDDIAFSPQIVPEPSVLALAALGFATLLVFRRQRRSGLPSKGRRRGEQAGSPINHAEAKREFWFLLCKLRKAILCAPAPLQRAMR